MSDVTKLLEEATPLPWHWDEATGGIRVADRYIKVAPGMNERVIWPDAALIVAAVNRLPDYEAAVDALELLVASDDALQERSGLRYIHEGVEVTHISSDALNAARVALARLREPVPS